MSLEGKKVRKDTGAWGQNNDAVDAAALEAAIEGASDEVKAEAVEFAKTMMRITNGFSVEGRAQLCHQILHDTHHVIAVDLDAEMMAVVNCPEGFILQTIGMLMQQMELPERAVERIRKIVMEEEEDG